MKTIRHCFSFDDVLILPNFSDIAPANCSTRIVLHHNLALKIPIIASPMDTVTESEMAIAIGTAGGLGIIHRNMSLEQQINAVHKVKSWSQNYCNKHNINIADFCQIFPNICLDSNNRILVGAAIGTEEQEFFKAQALLKAGVDAIVIDVAHGHSERVKGIITKLLPIIHNEYDKCLIAGNVVTSEGANYLIKLGVDVIKVGVGPGSICTTRIVAGVGVPQLSAIMDIAKSCHDNNIPLIADGGIRHSGDISKALAAGASCVMVGSTIAGTDEAPGEIVTFQNKQYKKYRGMGSANVINCGLTDRYAYVKQNNEQNINDDKNENKYNAKLNVNDNAKLNVNVKLNANLDISSDHNSDKYMSNIIIPQGVEGYVEYKGSVQHILENLVSGLKVSMSYTGSNNVQDMWQRCEFVSISTASMIESNVHSISIIE